MESKEKKPKKIRVRGTGTYDPADNSFGFVAFNEGESTQKDVKSCVGGGKSWTTTGVNPSRMLSLKCKVSSADQYNDLVTQFNQLTRDLKRKKPVAMPSELRVVSEGGLQCWLNEQTNEVTFTGTIDLARHTRDWQAEVLRQVQLVVRRLPANQQFNKVINTLKMEETSNV